MIIRQANIEDKPAIVELLKESLGESLLKKSTTIWDYKHVDNPFGESYVLLAEENGEFIGVRAFMSWKWQIGKQVWQAYRAVDTATHPNHQGKGIFKKLTLQALADVGAKQDCFIFNTPNEKSRPGYLKMGWESLGKISIALVPSLVYTLGSFLNNGKKYLQPLSVSELDKICEKHNKELEGTGQLFTPKSPAYLAWRYENNPMQPYQILTGNNWYVAVYQKKHRYFTELRIAEVIGGNTKATRKEIKAVVTHLALKNKCLLISTTEKNLFSLKYFGAIGPILTCRDLTAEKEILTKSKQAQTWHYAMGDLELF
ncbi:GNAT family N-acetyltransferase [Flavobacterium sp.]|uniref:GNAT family N-acetyltransferase n=1 Tax=Flavobacterium sp. TaxID=239 RepID=UPI002627C1C4|nr:GNAT family N-acetyltransferase [Flavobacterium sp.]MDD2985961.1 GNAT family N-acetyltransferase [Flavobacterium sp.]